MEQKKQNEQQPKRPELATPNRFSWGKMVTYIILFAFLIIILVSMFNTNQGTFVDVTTFREQIGSGVVKTVEYNATTIDIEYKDGTRAWFYNRSEIGAVIAEEINEYNTTNPQNTIVLISNKTTSFSILSLLYPLLLIGSMVFMIYFISRQIGRTNNKSFDFIKNRARITSSKTKFSNVAGLDEEKEEVKEIVEFLKNPKKFTQMGARIPKGVILIGAPGTGKTLLAKAIAGEANVPFFTISGSDFMELFVGVGASRVRDLFEQAKKASPCIVFIDEIDAIGRQRGTGMGGGNDEREQTLNQLLVQMDGFDTNEGVIVIAATNRADILDPALMRPGRFDRQIMVHMPDVKGREEILKVHSHNKKFSSDVDLKQIARITIGFTGADLENLLNESAILAAREDKTEIDMIDITEGIGKVTMGPQKKSRVVTERDRKITAIHESGHAIMGLSVKHSEPIHEVSIIPRGMAAGYTVSRPDTDDNHITKGKLQDMITMLLAGRIAEKLFLDDISSGASSDIQRATAIAKKMIVEFGMSDEVGLMHLGSENSYFFGKDYMERNTYSEASAELIDKEIRKILKTSEDQATEILKKNKKKLDTMVEVLLAKSTLYSDEIDLIMSGKSAKHVIKVIEDKSKKIEEKKNSAKQAKGSPTDTSSKPEPAQIKKTNITQPKDSIVHISPEEKSKTKKTNAKAAENNSVEKISENIEDVLKKDKDK